MKGKPTKQKKKVVVAVSGGFDPIHIGHIRLFEEAKKLGDELVVILNNDNWMHAKKGYSFMSESDRREIIQSLRAVDRVIMTDHKKDDSDRSICRQLKKVRPDIFANGGDRDEKDADNPNSSLYKEKQIHKKFGIKMVYNVGKGGKVRSSSALVARFREAKKMLP